jgi:hypothetical protein
MAINAAAPVAIKIEYFQQKKRKYRITDGRIEY